MRKLLTSICILIFTATGSGYGYDNGDFQVWNTDAQDFKLNKKLKIAFEQEFRFGDDANVLGAKIKLAF